MFDILKEDKIFEVVLTLKQIAFYLKKYCDLYENNTLTDKNLLDIIFYFSNKKKNFINENSDLNSTISIIIGKKRTFIIKNLILKYME